MAIAHLRVEADLRSVLLASSPWMTPTGVKFAACSWWVRMNRSALSLVSFTLAFRSSSASAYRPA